MLSSLLKRRQIRSPEPCAIATAQILRQVVAKARWNDADALLERVQKVGKRLVESQPRELTIGNITMRVLGLIRDEADEERNDGDDSQSESVSASEATSEQGGYFHPEHSPELRRLNPARPAPLTSFSSFSVPRSLFHILAAEPWDTSESGWGSGVSSPARANAARVHALRSEIIDGIEEILDEISQVDEQVAGSAEVQVQPGEFILLHQPSRTVTKFILKAAAKRKFSVFLVSQSSGPSAARDDFKALKEKLTALGVTVTGVSSSSIRAYMPRVDKVILGARAVVASGGVLVNAGAGAVARAAKAEGKPVVILSGVYKISPNRGTDPNKIIEWGAASTAVDYTDGKVVDDVEVKAAISEFVPPELVDIYITNL